ncbi:MAG: hypothetical protein F7O42_11885 [Opitutae bacterium]|nr:hypothetical protein [Opitutae bacterium]
MRARWPGRPTRFLHDENYSIERPFARFHFPETSYEFFPGKRFSDSEPVLIEAEFRAAKILQTG